MQSTRVKLNVIKEIWQTATILARGLLCLRSDLETMVAAGGHFRDVDSQIGWVNAPSSTPLPNRDHRQYSPLSENEVRYFVEKVRTRSA
jgi:hypothetical protein